MSSSSLKTCWGCTVRGDFAQCSRCGVALCASCLVNNPFTRIGPCPDCKRLVCHDPCRKCALHLKPHTKLPAAPELPVDAALRKEEETKQEEEEQQSPQELRRTMLSDVLHYIQQEALDGDNKEVFHDRIGDIIFLLSNAARGMTPGSEVKTQTMSLLISLMNTFNGLFGKDGVELPEETERLLNWVEGTSGRATVGMLPEGLTLDVVKKALRKRLKSIEAHELIPDPLAAEEFDEVTGLPLTEHLYCKPCGAFRAEDDCEVCGKPTAPIIDHDVINQAMGWCNMLHELGLDPIEFHDRELSISETMEMIPQLRPWIDYKVLGFNGFLLQGYLITHFVFFISKWGSYRLPRARFQAEFDHIATNMYAAVENKHVDLVGEFIYTLRILGADDAHPAIVQGTAFLLETQRTSRDAFYGIEDDFHQRFHTAYCVLFGLADWRFGPTPDVLPHMQWVDGPATPVEEKQPPAAAAVETKESTQRIAEDLTTVYRLIKQHTEEMAGGSGGSAYGEMTSTSMQKILRLMTDKAGLGPASKFIDIGSGLGKPSLHAALFPGVAVSFGVEISHERWRLSVINLDHALQIPALAAPPRVWFQEADATKFETLDPFTHVFLFDAVFPPDALQPLARALNQSTTVTHVFSFQPLDKFPLNATLVQDQPVKLTGSGEQRTGHLYRMHANVKPALPPAPPIQEGLKQLQARPENYARVVAALVSQFQNAPRQTRSGRAVEKERKQ